MSEIQARLNALGDSRITPAVLHALDYIVPGEWEDVTSLEQAIAVYLEVEDPTEVAAIKARAEELYASEARYGRALKLYSAADSVDKVAAAAVLAKQVGKRFDVLGILDRFTPKEETTQSIDAALKLAAELAAFACLRGIPLTSLADAKAFPATLATYAKADMMRMAAWITMDGVVPLGPSFVSTIHATVKDTDTSVLTENALFKQLASVLPGGDAEGQKGFILSSLESANGYVTEFVAARGLTQESLSGMLSGLFGAADASMDVLGATLDASTDYFAHTGVQSVARVLVHDAQESLVAVASDGPPPPPPIPQAETPVAETPAVEEPGSWFKTAAIIGGGAAALMGGIAVGGLLLRGKADEADDEDDEDLDDDESGDDAELDALDDNQLEAREAALRMQGRGNLTPEQRMKMQRMRRRLRRARRRRGRARPGPRRGRGGRGGRGRGGGGRGGGRGRR